MVAGAVLPGVVLPGVVLPDVGQQPAPYSPSGLLVAVGVLAVLVVVAFVWFALGAGRLVERGVPVVRVALGLAALMVVVVGVAAWIGTREEASHDEAEREYWDARRVVEDGFVADLEAHYGIDVLDPFAVSVHGTRTLVEIDRGDGPEECWVGATDDVVEVRCDGDDWDSATPLDPVEDGDD